MAVAKKTARPSSKGGTKVGKKPAVKKRATKKTAPKKKVTKKAVRKKTAAKSPAKKRVSTAQTKTKPKKAAQKIKTKQSAKTNKEAVVLPSAAGPRLTSKVEALHALVDALHVPMYRTAYIAAAVFLLVGLFTLGVGPELKQSTQSANSCTAVSCEDTLNELPVSNENLSLEILDNPPEQVVNLTQVSVKAVAADELFAEVVSPATGKRLRLETQALSSTNYKLMLNPEVLVAGLYVIEVTARSSILSQTRLITSSVFEIPPKETELVESAVTNVIGTTDSTEAVIENDVESAADTVEESFADDSANTEPDIVNENIPVSTTEESNVQTVPDEQSSPETVTESDDTTELEIETVEPEMIPEEDMISVKDNEIKPTGLELFVRKNDGFATRTVIVSSQTNYQSVELYVRLRTALQSQFLGQMRFVQNQWMYTFAVDQLPNGQYEVFAIGKGESISVDTSNIEFITIENELPAEASTAVMNESVALDTIEEDEVSDRFVTIDQTNNSDDFISTATSSEVAVNILRNNQVEINALLKRYSVAKQAENTLILDAVEKEIEQKRKSLVREAITSTNDESLQSLDTSLRDTFTDLQNRIDTFESIRVALEGEEIRTDSDRDGISDKDEIEIYGTDPNNADTDQDGFIDGAEIARGYNPTDATAEVAVEYELPTETVGLEREDALVVSAVDSVVVQREDTGDAKVFAEIRGQGLPNSFVTLYVFSSPTIVTVKTDNDGSFVYRFEKELADGSHEVYVAFTDNAGSILAQSPVFGFVKEAEAFTPVAQSAEPTVTPPTIVESSTVNAVQLVLGLSIVVLGFFLLMLGINLKHSKEEELPQIA